MAKSLKFKTELTRSPADSGWHFLIVEKEIVVEFGFDGNSRRVVCAINDGVGFQCALLPSGQMFYIIVNQRKRRELGIEAGDTVDVVLTKDESKYGLPMPEEFREVLDQDPDGDKLFHSLTAGKQRSLLYFLGNVKDIDRRIHQALIIVEHLKEHGKVIDKVLYEDLRRPVADFSR
jgi:hypothetical protein